MARASVPTLLPLDTWARLMGISPWEFNQIGEGFPVTNSQQCPYVWFQYQYQQNFLSREEVAEAIASAEQMIAQQLMYWPAPKGFTEKIDYPRPANRSLWGMGGTPRGQFKSVQLGWGKVQHAGVYKRELIGTTSVARSDNDGDTVKEKFTAIIATTVTAIDEIAIYFKETDRNSETVDETWRIRPVKVAISGGNATITGHAALLVKPDLESAIDAESLDVTDDAIYVTEVEVYRFYIGDDTDLSEQGIAIWEEDCELAPCEVTTNAVCISPRIGEQGVVAVDYFLNEFCHDWEPNRLQLNYIAGVPLVNGTMDDTYARIVARLATALLPVDKCGCDRSQRILTYWRDVNPAEREGMRTSLVGDLDANPFGEKRGAWWAWHQVRELKQVWGTSV